jgi:uracil-DNA glycosylase
MDARAALRRLLEQRLEAGETTIVLETMQADVILSAAKERGSRSETRSSPGANDVPRPSESPSFASLRMTEPVRETLEQRRAGPSEGSGDWRSALQASGSQSGTRTSEQGMPVQKASPAPRAGKIVVTPDAPLPPMESLGDVAAAVRTCTRCPLYATAINPVPGEGNPEADFMVVGEAPGATEDETGKPFVGRAGQLLTQILEAIQLKREDVFICNVLKHRPPGNRNPEPDEVKACSPYLIRQIELIRPKVILALGTFSAQTLLETKTPIGKLRGQVHEYHGVPVVVTYHPAALLRNPAWKRPTWEDVQLARRILDSAPPRA